jgi:Phage capsid protein
MNEQKLTSSDYGMQRLMMNEIVNFGGLAIKCVAPHLLPYDSVTDIRTCVAFARSSVVFGMLEAPMSKVDHLIDGDYDIQIYSRWGWGACRKQDEGVITIDCDESP